MSVLTWILNRLSMGYSVFAHMISFLALHLKFLWRHHSRACQVLLGARAALRCWKKKWRLERRWVERIEESFCLLEIKAARTSEVLSEALSSLELSERRRVFTANMWRGFRREGGSTSQDDERASDKVKTPTPKTVETQLHKLRRRLSDNTALHALTPHSITSLLDS